MLRFRWCIFGRKKTEVMMYYISRCVMSTCSSAGEVSMITWLRSCVPDLSTVQFLFFPFWLVHILQGDTLWVCKNPVSRHGLSNDFNSQNNSCGFRSSGFVFPSSLLHLAIGVSTFRESLCLEHWVLSIFKRSRWQCWVES